MPNNGEQSNETQSNDTIPVKYVDYWHKYQKCIACKREVRDLLHLYNHYLRYHAKRQTTIHEARLLTTQETISIVDNLLAKAGLSTYSLLLASMEQATKLALAKPRTATPPTNHIQRAEGETLVDYVSRYMEAYL